MNAAVVPLVCAAAAVVASDPDPVVARQQMSAPHQGPATLDISGDASVVAFVSAARLSSADTNAVEDIYVLDRRSGRISLESLAPGGGVLNGTSEHPRLSHDGRYLVFTTAATNVVEPPSELPLSQVIRRDRETGATVLVSWTPGAGTANGNSWNPDLSDDGRFVVFQSTATDLVDGGDRNGRASDIYLFDAAEGVVSRVSLDNRDEQPASGASWTARLSGDGRFMVFVSTAPLDASLGSQAAAGGPVANRQIYVRDFWRRTTRRISSLPDGSVPDGASFHPAINADGRWIAFASTATNLVDPRQKGRAPSIFLYDAASSRITSIGAGPGTLANGTSTHPAVSADGRYVVFSSDASNLACPRCAAVPDLNLVSDIYRFDAVAGSVQRVSGRAGREPWWVASTGAAIDAAGTTIAFSSRQPIGDWDLGHDDDLFVEELAPRHGCQTERTQRQRGTSQARAIPSCAPH